MKYSIEAMTIEPEFRWSQDEDGDWALSSRLNGGWVYWGLVCPHNRTYYEIVADGQLFAEFPQTLEGAKSRAEEFCAGDILRDLAKIKKETD